MMDTIGTVFRTKDGREWVWKPDYGELYEIVEHDDRVELVEHSPTDDEQWSWADAKDYVEAIASNRCGEG